MINIPTTPILFATDPRFVLAKWNFYNERLVNKDWRNSTEEHIVRSGERYYRELWCVVTNDEILKQAGLVPFAGTFFG